MKAGVPDKPDGGVFETGNFLTVTGVVDGEGSLSVDPGFRVTYRRRTTPAALPDESLENAVILEFRDQKGDIQTQRAIPLQPLCVLGAAGTNPLRAFAASISVPLDYHAIRYYVGQQLPKEVRKPKETPVVRFIRAPRERVADSEPIAWHVTHGADADIRSIVLFSHTDGRSWQAVSPPSSVRENAVGISFASLPGGRGRLRVLATDGFSTASVESEAFDVPLKGVRPSILGPAENATVSSEATTWFHGQAYDYEAQAVSPAQLVWHSSCDGELGRGPVVAARLSPGRHELTLSCGAAEVRRTIVATPTIATSEHVHDSRSV
jgi:hypothetical protein